MFDVVLHRLLLFSFVGAFCFVFAVRAIALPSFPAALVATGYTYIYIYIFRKARQQLEVLIGFPLGKE